MERADWTDARIGDQFRALWQRVGALDKTNERLAVIERELNRLARTVADADFASAQDMHECRTAVKALADAFTARSEAREAERKEREKERKVDRRWLVGTILTAAALVIAAMGVLIPILTGPT